MEISVIVSLMGGLGLFLLGMKQMSDGLEKAAVSWRQSRPIRSWGPWWVSCSVR